VWGAVLLALAGMLAVQPAAGAQKRGDLVVLGHDRWLDTLRGTVKNFSRQLARDVTVVVRFLDKKRKPLGTQQVALGALGSGEQAAFDLAIEERHRAAASYQFAVHAIWR
jgi:hypothetical protein